jgi:hypothetical protein
MLNAIARTYTKTCNVKRIYTTTQCQYTKLNAKIKNYCAIILKSMISNDFFY